MSWCVWSGDVSQTGYYHTPNGKPPRSQAGAVVECPGCGKPVKLRQPPNGHYSYTQIPRHKKGRKA